MDSGLSPKIRITSWTLQCRSLGTYCTKTLNLNGIACKLAKYRCVRSRLLHCRRGTITHAQPSIARGRHSQIKKLSPLYSSSIRDKFPYRHYDTRHERLNIPVRQMYSFSRFWLPKTHVEENERLNRQRHKNQTNRNTDADTNQQLATTEQEDNQE